MHFLLQTIRHQIVHDFTFAVLRAKEFYDWARDPFDITFVEIGGIEAIREPDLYVPVGSVEFVSAYLRHHYPNADPAMLMPINVPEVLFPFAGRKIADIVHPEDVRKLAATGIQRVYRKSLLDIKDKDNGVTVFEADNPLLVMSQVSELIDIRSEWRVFVFHGQILHAACYCGEPLVFPDADAIRAMVAAYDGAPSAWTLDVAVTAAGDTVVIECHRFFSCGLYGFNDYARLPKMLSQAWNEMKNSKR